MSRSPRRTVEQWQALVDQQHASGLSAPQFCQRNNLGYPSFCAWRKRLNQSTDVAGTQPAFVELTTPPETHVPNSAVWKVELDLGAGVCLRITRP